MTIVIVILVSLCTILCVVVGLPLFIVYMIRNSIQAAKYRSMSITVPIKTGYTIVYKSGRKTETVDVDGDTDSEAMRDLIKRGISYDKIISLTKR